jgi:cell division protein FtsB
MSDQYRRAQADPDEIIKAARRRARAASSRRRGLVGDADDSSPVFEGNLAVQPATVPVEAPPAEIEAPAAPQRETVVLPRTRTETKAKPAPEAVEVPRPAFVGGILALVVAGIFGLLVLNTVINEDAYRLQELRTQAGELDQTEQALEDELSHLDTPVYLQAQAELYGMVHPEKVTFLYLPGGETVEVPWNEK